MHPEAEPCINLIDPREQCMFQADILCIVTHYSLRLTVCTAHKPRLAIAKKVIRVHQGMPLSV